MEWGWRDLIPLDTTEEWGKWSVGGMEGPRLSIHNWVSGVWVEGPRLSRHNWGKWIGVEGPHLTRHNCRVG